MILLLMMMMMMNNYTIVTIIMGMTMTAKTIKRKMLMDTLPIDVLPSKIVLKHMLMLVMITIMIMIKIN